MGPIITRILAILLLMINLTIMGIITTIIAGLDIITLKAFHQYISNLINKTYTLWVKINKLCLFKLTTTTLEINLPQHKQLTTWHLITCNHASWADILILQIALNQSIPPLKFCMKQSLIWVPFVGIIAKMLNYPFIKRYSLSQIKRDPKKKLANKNTIANACKLLKQQPTSLVIFPEATRITYQKITKNNSKYQQLLTAKGSGVQQALTAWQDLQPNWYDISISYNQQFPTLWELLSGKYKAIKIHGNLIKFDPKWVTMSNKEFQTSLNKMWQQKDIWLSSQLQQ